MEDGQQQQQQDHGGRQREHARPRVADERLQVEPDLVDGEARGAHWPSSLVSRRYISSRVGRCTEMSPSGYSWWSAQDARMPRTSMGYSHSISATRFLPRLTGTGR